MTQVAEISKNDIYDTVRKNIKHYRKEKGLTQAELSEKMGVCHDFVRQVESKKVKKNFSLANMQKAAEVLGIKTYELLMDEKDDTHNN